MRSSRLCRCAALAFIPALACLAAGGCAKNSAEAFRANPTPELDTRWQRRDDIDNRLTVTNDTNLRMFNEEVGRVLLLDKPSRLTPSAVPY